MIENEIYTGAVRRLDDLHRIVIPKDICEKARIKDGTALEVYYTNAGDIILRPYDPRRVDRENIRQADKAIQALNNRINIIVFDKDEVIYSYQNHSNSVPINNTAIIKIMKEEWINTDKLKKEIQRTHPNASVSVDDEEGLAIAIVNSMGEQADEIIFNYLWKNIKK